MLGREEGDFRRVETKQGEKKERLMENCEKIKKQGCLRREKCGDKKGGGGRNEEKRTWGEMRT